MFQTAPCALQSATVKICHLAIVIPARNEAPSVAGVVRRVRAASTGEVIVVDDCSTDATAEEARAAGAIVLSLPVQLGAWGATQTGLRYAIRHGAKSVLTMDADGQHHADSIAILERAQASTNADLVIGSAPERLSRPKRLARLYFRVIAGLEVRDFTSGFRLYSERAARLLSFRHATLFDYQDLGVLMLLKNYGLSVVEAKVNMSERNHGMSRVFSSWSHVARYMALTSMVCLARAGRARRPT